jgi:trk system potassium uptake protein TrkH
MVNQDIGAVVITRGKLPIGIITERDILQRVVRANRDPSKTLVGDVMSKPVITVDYKATSKRALEIMREHKIRRLVVVEGEKFAGLVTERRVLGTCSLLSQWN